MEYFKTIFQNTGMAILIIDKDSKIVMANSMFEKVSGYSIDELRGKSFIQLVDPEYLDIVLENYHRRQLEPDHTPSKYEVKWIAKHGQVRDVIINAAILPDSKTVVYLFDITEQRQAEKNLKASEERFHTLFSNMAEGVALHELILDANCTPVDYRIIEINPSYERIMGWQREAIIGKLSTELYRTPEPPYLQEFSGVAQTNIGRKMEVYFKPLDKHLNISIVPWSGNARGKPSHPVSLPPGSDPLKIRQIC